MLSQPKAAFQNMKKLYGKKKTEAVTRRCSIKDGGEQGRAGHTITGIPLVKLPKIPVYRTNKMKDTITGKTAH